MSLLHKLKKPLNISRGIKTKDNYALQFNRFTGIQTRRMLGVPVNLFHCRFEIFISFFG